MAKRNGLAAFRSVVRTYMKFSFSCRVVQVLALNSLSVWLSNDVKRVESMLVRPSSIESLVGMIHSCEGKTFEQISGPLLDMMAKSVPLRKVRRPPLGCPAESESISISMLCCECEGCAVG